MAAFVYPAGPADGGHEENGEEEHGEGQAQIRCSDTVRDGVLPGIAWMDSPE